MAGWQMLAGLYHDTEDQYRGMGESHLGNCISVWWYSGTCVCPAVPDIFKGTKNLMHPGNLSCRMMRGFSFAMMYLSAAGWVEKGKGPAGRSNKES